MTSLRIRLPLLISGLIAVTLVAFLSVSYRQVQRELLQAGQARAQAAADQLASLLAQSAQNQLTEVQRAAQDPAVRRYLDHPDEETEGDARKRLAALATVGQPPVELWLAGRERPLVVAPPLRTDRPVAALPPSARPAGEGVGAFAATGQTVYWSVVREARGEAEPAVGAGGARGFVMTRRVLTSSNADAIGRLVGAGALIRLGNADGGAWSDLARPVAAPMVPVRPGPLDGDRAADGERLVGAAAAIRGTPWIVLVQFPRSAIVAPARTFLLRMLAVAAGLVLFAAVAAHALSSRITTPLAQLTRAAEAIAQGRFEPRVRTGRRDEIGRLDAAFETMATEVQTSRRDLEVRVEERTRAVGALNAQLEGRVAELKATSEELEAFSYSVSHDLRAPLRHVAGFAALLQQRAGPALDAVSETHLRRITDAAARMGRLIDELLTFSRMGRAEMQRAAVPLDDVVQEVVREVEHETTGRRIDWTVHPLPAVAGDPAMLRLALTNLISNAVKYTSTRDVARIEIGAQPATDGERVVYVRDNGVGFDMAYAHRLFGVFQRLHGADEFEGTGIGLANVRRIVHRHGGRTWAEGAVDHGATFFIALPAHERTSVT
jgi:signal transduction histidine kinase